MCSGEFTREGSDMGSNSIIVDRWSAGPGRIREPGPASVGKATAPFTDGFTCTRELYGDFGIVVSVSGEEDNTCAESIPL